MYKNVFKFDDRQETHRRWKFAFRKFPHETTAFINVHFLMQRSQHQVNITSSGVNFMTYVTFCCLGKNIKY
jgi:hypothetical protein